jgi:hypothetical protein
MANSSNTVCVYEFNQVFGVLARVSDIVNLTYQTVVVSCPVPSVKILGGN